MGNRASRSYGTEDKVDGAEAWRAEDEQGPPPGAARDSLWPGKAWDWRVWDRRSLTRLGVVLVLLTVCSWLGIALSRQSGGVATIWLSNGILFGLVITQPRTRWLGYFAVGLIADTSADVFWGDGFWLALGVSAANSFEVITSCVVLTRIFGHPFNLSRRRPLLGFLGVSVVGAAAVTSALGASWTMLFQDAGPWLQLFRTWYLGDLLGMALMAPLTFMLQREDFFSILHPARLGNTLLLLLVPAAATLLVFSHDGDPLIFFLFPALMLIVFRLGFPGTVTTIFVVALISIGMTVKGHGPLMLIRSDIQGDHVLLHRIVVDQIFLAVAIFTLFPVAALLEERASLQLCLEASEARYRSLASLDELTGLANRRAFNQRLSEEMQSERETALLLIDVDLFKRYNDHYGHMLGDECLQALAAAISGAATRPDAFVSRFGGEEFAVILPGTDLRQGRVMAEEIRTAVVEMRLPHPATQIGYQTVSVGVSASASAPVEGAAGAAQATAADLIGRADMALYRAMDLGRNRVVAA